MIHKKFVVYVVSNVSNPKPKVKKINSSNEQPKVKKINSSNEHKKYINESLNFTFNIYNKLINEKILGLKLKKSNYKKNIDKGNNYIFSQYLKKEIIVIIYNFCSPRDKKRLLIVYVICKIKKYNNLIDKLEMNFGKFLCERGFSFSDEYKIKYSVVKIKEELKIPNFKIFLDKLKQKKKSKKNKIETIPAYEEIIKKFNLNVPEISANDNINNDYINEIIKKYNEQIDISKNPTSNNTVNDNNNNDENSILIESAKIISNEISKEKDLNKFEYFSSKDDDNNNNLNININKININTSNNNANYYFDNNNNINDNYDNNDIDYNNNNDFFFNEQNQFNSLENIQEQEDNNYNTQMLRKSINYSSKHLNEFKQDAKNYQTDEIKLIGNNYSEKV